MRRCRRRRRFPFGQPDQTDQRRQNQRHQRHLVHPDPGRLFEKVRPSPGPDERTDAARPGQSTSAKRPALALIEILCTDPVHEQIFRSIEVRRGEWGLENRLGHATLLHHGYTPEMTRDRQKNARNLRRLERALAELPNEPNLLMNYGLEMARTGQRPRIPTRGGNSAIANRRWKTGAWWKESGSVRTGKMEKSKFARAGCREPALVPLTWTKQSGLVPPPGIEPGSTV